MNLIDVNEYAFSDLHIHTTESDGLFTPREILGAVKYTKLRTLAFADHHNISAYEKNKCIAGKMGIELIPAVEISADTKRHILGYGMSDLKSVKEKLCKIAVSPETRFRNIIQILRNEYDINVEDEMVQDIIESSMFGGDALSAMLSKYDLKEPYDYVSGLQKNGNGVTPLHEGYIIETIQKSGGVACLAHPHRYEHRMDMVELDVDRSMEAWDKVLDKQRRQGLRAIEISPSCSPFQRMFYTSLANNHNLLKLGGTDFHGWQTSSTLGNQDIKGRQLEFLRHAIANSNRAALKNSTQQSQKTK